jgi:hypothetical protein
LKRGDVQLRGELGLLQQQLAESQQELKEAR